MPRVPEWAGRRAPLSHKRAHALVACHQRRATSPAIIAAIVVEAPCGMRHGEIVGGDVDAGEIEVDQAGDLVAQHQHVVGEQVGSGSPNAAMRPASWRSSHASAASSATGSVGSICASASRPHRSSSRLPCGERHALARVAGNSAAARWILRQRVAHRSGLCGRGMVDRNAGQEFDQRHRLAVDHRDRLAPSDHGSCAGPGSPLPPGGRAGRGRRAGRRDRSAVRTWSG